MSAIQDGIASVLGSLKATFSAKRGDMMGRFPKSHTLAEQDIAVTPVNFAAEGGHGLNLSGNTPVKFNGLTGANLAAMRAGNPLIAAALAEQAETGDHK